MIELIGKANLKCRVQIIMARPSIIKLFQLAERVARHRQSKKFRNTLVYLIDFVLEVSQFAAIPGRHLSSLISMAYIFGFRKDNAIFFNGLGKKLPCLGVSNKVMSLILLDLCLRKRKK
jgi:hypothetical protein